MALAAWASMWFWFTFFPRHVLNPLSPNARVQPPKTRSEAEGIGSAGTTCWALASERLEILVPQLLNALTMARVPELRTSVRIAVIPLLLHNFFAEGGH